jgi:ATP-dependent Clp endopeptidase proteolytic subunit ClpP
MRYILDVDPRVNFTDEMITKIWKLPSYVNFIGSFTEESAAKFREDLIMAENSAIKCQQEIIPVVIDSYGGSVYALMSMIDAINNCKLKVATIVESKAMSCGAVLFSCGAEGYRYIGPNATVMIHTVSLMEFGKIDEIKAGASEGERLNEKLFSLMSRNCGHKDTYFLDELKERKMADWYLDAKDCVKHKLANKIHIPSMNVKVHFDYKFE